MILNSGSSLKFLARLKEYGSNLANKIYTDLKGYQKLKT